MADFEHDKIFRRNLTARAFRIVPGNAAATRPESATDVCTPGLDIDLRTLEEQFFPGLVWEFEGKPGVRLVDMLDGAYGLRRNDWLPARRSRSEASTVFLWAMYGRVHRERTATKPDQTDDLQFHFFGSMEARQAWRRVRDLAKGRVAIIIGFGLKPFDKLQADVVRSHLRTAMKTGSQPLVVSSAGKPRYAVIAADRREYLDPGSGVIVDAYGPGDLTKGLCSPWQLDFRDCGCRYWAASKPDIVHGNEPGEIFNFNRDRQRFPKAPDVADADERDKQKYSTEQMIAGAWQNFPTVIAGREAPSTALPDDSELLPTDELYNARQAAAELCYLATVEHALLVEYLCAVFSIRRCQPETSDTAVWRKVSGTILSIAQDEMRHFMWVNEMLRLLGKAPSLGRARVIGADPARTKVDPATQRRKPCVRKRAPIAYENRPFRASPLTREALDSFIAVEKGSQTLDGMYGRLYQSVRQRRTEFPHPDKLLALLKLVIDEGEDHFHRFMDVKGALAGRREEEWLIPLGKPKDPRRCKLLRSEGAAFYHTLLDVLSVSFTLTAGGDKLFGLARDLMTALDEVALEMARLGVLFDFPEKTSDEASLSPRAANLMMEARAAAGAAHGIRKASACRFCDYDERPD